MAMHAITRLPLGRVLRGFAICALLTVGNAVSSAAERPVSEKEQVLFFPSLASQSSIDTSWSVTIQGRIFEPTKGSWGRERLLDLAAARLLADPKDPVYRDHAGWLVS